MKLAVLFLMLTGSALAGPIDEGYCSRIADAIWAAEGGNKARVAYGVISVPTRSPGHAREVCLETIRKNWERWQNAGSLGSFLEFLSRRYAPIGAANDPKGLNRNWVRNVRARMPRPRDFSVT